MNAQIENLIEVRQRMKRQRMMIATLSSAIITLFILYVFI